MSEDSALIVYATRAMELIRKLRAKARRRYQELETCRAALDKTAIERDGFHGELMAAQGQVIRLGLQVPRWQPTESAPQDGKPFLGLLPDGQVATLRWCPHRAAWELAHEAHLWDNCTWSVRNAHGRGGRFKPTHWMPLPEPPKETT